MIAQKKQQIVLIALALGLTSMSQPLASYGKDSDKASKKASSKTSSKKSDSGKSESSSSTQGGDQAAVSAVLVSVSKSLADGDVKGLVSLWAQDGNYVGVDGGVCKGKDNLEKRFTSLQAVNGKQHVDLSAENIRFLAPNVALAEGVVKRRNGDYGPRPETRFSMVLQKQDAGNWLISSVSETSIQADAGGDPLEQLSWLIGEWSAENKGGSVHMNAAWAPHRNFIVCTYEVKKSADSPLLESKQIIGWDPRTEQPISWHFDSSGGFGYGSWVKKNKQWLVEASGIDRDGSTNSATNVISPNDNDNFTWQSVDRSLNGVTFNDTDALKVHRIK